MKSWMNEEREMTSRVFSEKGAGSFGKGSDCEREAQNYKLIWMSSCKTENPSPRWKCAGASWGKGWRNRFLMVIEISRHEVTQRRWKILSMDHHRQSCEWTFSLQIFSRTKFLYVFVSFFFPRRLIDGAATYTRWWQYQHHRPISM